MKIIDSILYIQWNELVATGVSNNTLRSAKLRNANGWCFIDDPADKRRVLVQYDLLRPEYKDLIKLKYGCPYQYLSSQLLDKHLVTPPSDTDILAAYTLPNGTYLPLEHLEKYNTACAYLHLLSVTSPKSARELGFPDLMKLTSAIIQLVEARNVSLPASYSKLKAKVREYEKEGATCVISKKFCNKNTEKISAQGAAYIKELFGYGNNYSIERVALEYNLHASQQGWLPLTTGAVRYNLNKMGLMQQLLMGRENEGEWRNKFDLNISRQRPSRPGMLWVGDATPFELYYQTETAEGGRNTRNYWNRKVVYVVIDAFNDAVMGFSIGETESSALAERAWYNACINTGIAPEQIKTDNFGSKELRSTYSALAKTPQHFTPSSVGNARDKVVEQFFGKINDAVLRDYHNYAGGNITAKKQPNRDLLNKIKSDFPYEEECVQQIVACLNRWNTMPRKKMNGKSLMEQWSDGDRTQLRILTDDLRLEVFGKLHISTNRLTKEGLRCTLLNEIHTYQLPTNEFADTIGTEYQVVYDPCDLSKILAVAKGGRFRFIVPEATTIPMAMGDFKEGDRTKLNVLLNFKYSRKQLIIERRAANTQLVEAEGLMKLWPVIKGTNKEITYAGENALKQLSSTQFEDLPHTDTVTVTNDNSASSHWYDENN